MRGMGPNKTAKAMQRASKAAAGIQQIIRKFNDASKISKVSQCIATTAQQKMNYPWLMDI